MGAADLEKLRELARLARLSLSEEELGQLAPELERILRAFEVLARHEPRPELAAAHRPAAPRPAGADRDHGREDEPIPSLEREALLASAPLHEDGFFVVPKTVGGAG